MAVLLGAIIGTAGIGGSIIAPVAGGFTLSGMVRLSARWLICKEHTS